MHFPDFSEILHEISKVLQTFFWFNGNTKNGKNTLSCWHTERGNEINT